MTRAKIYNINLNLVLFYIIFPSQLSTIIRFDLGLFRTLSKCSEYPAFFCLSLVSWVLSVTLFSLVSFVPGVMLSNSSVSARYYKLVTLAAFCIHGTVGFYCCCSVLMQLALSGLKINKWMKQ
jgi:hypothetical protein